MAAPSGIDFDQASAQDRNDVAQFLDLLNAEQARFLAAIPSVDTLTIGGEGRLGSVVAAQVRMLRELLDAQRSIIRLCSETEQAIDEFASTASFNRALIYESAETTARAIESGLDIDLAPPLGRTATVATSLIERLSAQLASTSVADPVRCRTDDSQRWTELLDEAWSEEMSQCLAALNNARADAELKVHDARIAARNSLAVARRRVPSNATSVARPSVLAAPILEALDQADDESLEDFLDGLMLELHGDETSATVLRESDGDLAVALSGGPNVIEIDGRRVEDEAFRRFWVTVGSPRRRRRPLPTRSWMSSASAVAVVVAWFVR